MAVAYVRGLQGDDIAHLKLAATVKHFAVYNVENGRQHHSAEVDERNLMEYWLPQWKAAIEEGHAQSVMSSYNAINGTPDAVNHYLLTDILRGQWGFDGFVTDDLGAVSLLTEGSARNAGEPGQRFLRTPWRRRPRPSKPGTTQTMLNSRRTFLSRSSGDFLRNTM